MPEILRAKVKVFVELYLLARQAERQALQHIALAEERAARVAAERSTQRLAFLARASAALAGSLDVEATMRELGRLVVPQLADAAIVLVLTGADDEPRARRSSPAGDGRDGDRNRPLGEAARRRARRRRSTRAAATGAPCSGCRATASERAATRCPTARRRAFASLRCRCAARGRPLARARARR